MDQVAAAVDDNRLADFLEARARRRRWNSRIVAGVALLLVVATGILVWKASRSVTAAARLSRFSIEVDWFFDERPWWSGGGAAVVYHPPRMNALGTPTPLTPADMSLFNQLPILESLDLSGCPSIRDDLVARLVDFPRLREFRLDSHRDGSPFPTGPVTDKTLDFVGRQHALQIVSLAGQSITDEGLPKLLGLARLEDLDLEATQVTGRGIQILSRWPSLKTLRISAGKVEPELIDQLQQAAPGVTVLQMSDD